MNEEERISEIRARCEAYKSDRSEATKASIGLTEEELILDGYLPSFSSLAAHVSQDVPFLLDLIESLRAQLEEMTNRNDENSGMCKIWARKNSELQAQLSESQRREKAAITDMNEAQGCACLICKQYTQGPIEQCERFKSSDFEKALVCGQFEWRGPQDEKGEKE